MKEKEFQELHRKIDYYYDKIFSGVVEGDSGSSKWTTEDNLNLEKMVELKDHVSQNANRFFSTKRLKRIHQLTEEAETFKAARQLQDRALVGLEQDPNFPRYKEYLQKLEHMHNDLEKASSEQEVFNKTKGFIEQSIDKINKRKLEARQKVITYRIEQARELVEISIKSPPITEREVGRKIVFLKEVLEHHLVPLCEGELTRSQKKALNEVIELYNQTIDNFHALLEAYNRAADSPPSGG